MGALGTAHYERGLAYFEVELSGHMVPEFSPVVRSVLIIVLFVISSLLGQAAYQIMEYLLGFRGNATFATQESSTRKREEL